MLQDHHHLMTITVSHAGSPDGGSATGPPDGDSDKS